MNNQENFELFSSGGPKVSCLMVTADRPALMKRALLCFIRQTYPNKELVVVDDGNTDLSTVLEDIPSEEVNYVKLKPDDSYTLGKLRNISLEQAGGDYLIQWDDDDWYHPERIDRQMAEIEKGYDASCLANALMHLDTPRYINHPYIGSLPGGIPGSIMHKKDSDIWYPETRRGEDTIYLKEWAGKKLSLLSDDLYYLFIRCFHGDNTWEIEHFIRRSKNSPLKWLQHFWYTYILKNEFGHPVYRLHDEGNEAIKQFLKDSEYLGLLKR